jgi:hypothetical protein
VIHIVLNFILLYLIVMFMLFLPQHVMLLKSFETFKSEVELHLVVFNCNIRIISSTSGFVVHLSFEACTSRLKLLKAVFVNL